MTKQIVTLSREQIEEYRSFIFQDENNVDLIVSRLLSVLGFKPSWCGTDFIREAVKYCYALPVTSRVLFNSTVYPYVAGLCGVKSECIERDIRTALHNCYFNGSIFKYNAICCYDIVSLNYPPTNVEFVTQTVSWIKSYSLAKIS